MRSSRSNAFIETNRPIEQMRIALSFFCKPLTGCCDKLRISAESMGLYIVRVSLSLPNILFIAFVTDAETPTIGLNAS